MGGITRVHGGLVQPKNLAGVTLADFTLTFWNGDCYGLNSEGGSPSTAGGALDQIFRTATGNVGTISRIGYLNTGTGVSANYIRFSIEMLGAEYADNSGTGYLGTGPDNAGQGDAEATPALALQAAIRALGTTGTAAIHLSSATVAAFYY